MKNPSAKVINRFHDATLLMPSLLHTVKTKGVSNTLKRMLALVQRYGIKGDRLKKNLIEYIDIIRKYDGRITYPIPAITLQRNIGFIKSIDQDFIEWSMHGYVHINYAEESADNFKKHLKMGKNIFKKSGIKLYGFRAPYLSINDEFLSEISGEGLSYDSSFSYNTGILDDSMDMSKSARKILKFYSPGEFNLRQYGKLTEIPVWLPDDEIIVDRLQLSRDKMEKYLMKAMNRSIKLRSPLILQLHPERFFFFRAPLENFLKVINKDGVKMSTLNEIAENFRKNGFLTETPAVAITGDIDIISISDLMAMKSNIELNGDENV